MALFCLYFEICLFPFIIVPLYEMVTMGRQINKSRIHLGGKCNVCKCVKEGGFRLNKKCVEGICGCVLISIGLVPKENRSPNEKNFFAKENNYIYH